MKEQDKENEKEKAKENPSAVTGESAAQETPVSGAPPLRGEAVPLPPSSQRGEIPVSYFAIWISSREY